MIKPEVVKGFFCRIKKKKSKKEHSRNDETLAQVWRKKNTVNHDLDDNFQKVREDKHALFTLFHEYTFLFHNFFLTNLII